MSLRGTLLLLLIAIGLLLGIIFLEPHYRVTSDSTIFIVHPETISQITITDGTESHSLQRQSHEWMLSTTPPDRADPLEVEHLLAIASTIKPLNILTRHDLVHQPTLSSLGLQNPQRSLLLQTPKETDQLLYFGNEAVGDKQLFAQLKHQKEVLVISSSLSDFIFRPLDEFRDHHLTALSVHDLNHITLHQGKGTMSLALAENRPLSKFAYADEEQGVSGAQHQSVHGVHEDASTGTTQQFAAEVEFRKRSQWLMKEPTQSLIDTQALTEWITPLLNASIITRIGNDDGDLAPYGLDQPRAEIKLSLLGKKDPITLSLGKKIEDKDLPEAAASAVYLRSSERHAIFKMPSALEQIFMINPDILRERQLFQINLDTVDRIQITLEGKTILLHRKEGDSSNWVIEEQNPKTFQGEALQAFVETLGQTSVSSFLPATPSHLKDAGLAAASTPIAGIRFIAHLSENTPDDQAGDHTVAEIQFGKPTGDSLLARKDSAPELLQIPAATLDVIRKFVAE